MEIKIDHIALWVSDLDLMRDFYREYFNAESGEKYTNPVKKFSSYFLKFGGSVKLELMYNPDVRIRPAGEAIQIGLAHLAISLGTKEIVLEMTEKIREAGYGIAGEPRTTGDGYFESVILDPEGNRIELTI
jgi:lactoylglutathione lyase